MFERVYRHIAEAVWTEIEPELQKEIKEMSSIFTAERLGSLLQEALNVEENQAFIIEFTDALFERYKQKVMGAVGGTLKGTIQAENENQFANLPIPAKYKKLLTNPFIKMLIGGLGSGETQKQSRLP